MVRFAAAACILVACSVSQAQVKELSTSLLVVDWLQTRTIAQEVTYVSPKRIDHLTYSTGYQEGRWRERNPILGPYPSLSKVNNYFAGIIALNLAIDDERWHYAVIAVEALVVIANRKAGITIKF